MVAYLSKSDASVYFDQVMDFLNAQVIQYALMVNPTIYVFCIKQFWASATIMKVNDVVKLRALIDGKRVVVTEDVIRQALHLDDADGVECLPNEEIFTELALEDLSSHNNQYTSPALTQKVFANMRRVGKGFFRVETPLFSTMLVQPQPPAAEEEDEEEEGRKDDVNIKVVSTVEPTVFDDEEITMTMAQTLIKMKAKKARLLDEQMAKRLHDEEVEQATTREKQEKDDLEIAKVLQKENINWKILTGMEYNKVQTLFKPDKDVEEPSKKRVAEETLLQESFKKLKAVAVSGFDSTQETPTNDPKEISEEDVQNMLEIVLISKFKVKALQVKYSIIDWEIHSEGLRTYWKIIRVGRITEA
nr:hypothetical protein [Tanacetum cinerariifolium]